MTRPLRVMAFSSRCAGAIPGPGVKSNSMANPAYFTAACFLCIAFYGCSGSPPEASPAAAGSAPASTWQGGLLAEESAAVPSGSPARVRDFCPGALTEYLDDFIVRQVPDSPEPPPRVPFRDPVFSACVVRITDGHADPAPDDPSAGLTNEYSRVQSFNADGSRILIRGTEGTWYLYNADSLLPLGEVPLGEDPRWSASNPDVVYYSEETRLMSFDIRTSAQAVVHEFAGDLSGYGAAMVWIRYEGSPSADGRWWGLMAENPDWLAVAYLVYDLQTDSVVALRDLRGRGEPAREIDSVTISPLGNYFLAFMDKSCGAGTLGSEEDPCGLMVYDRTLRNGRGLLRIIGHADTALDSGGREALVYQDIDSDDIALLDLESGAAAPLWPIDFSRCAACGLHFSGRALRRPGRAVVSYYDGDPVSHTWMDDQVFAVELRPGGRIARLAHHHSAADPGCDQDYWAEPHASADWDLTRILFTANWGRSGTAEVEANMILLPEPLQSRPPTPSSPI
jgi:hypothetical protein